MLPPGPDAGASAAARVDPRFARLATYAWGTVGIVAVALGMLWLLGRLWVVVLPAIIAVLLTRVLDPVATRLRPRLGAGLAAALTVLAFVVVAALVVGGLGAAVGSEVGQLGATVTTGIDDVERWLVEEAPVEVTRADIARVRQSADEAASRWLRRSSGSVLAGVLLAGELLLSVVIGLIVTFFLLKDGRRLLRWLRTRIPDARTDLAQRLGARAWSTLGGYLRGAAILGVVEGSIAALTITLVGGELGVAVGFITFLLAFIPFAGAIIASVLAVLVALATAGAGGAAVVAAVALVVQQLDNDVLAPVVYGRQLSVHPVLILLSIIGGGALFGAPGTVLAVPVTAVAYNLVAEAAAGRPERDGIGDGTAPASG